MEIPENSSTPSFVLVGVGINEVASTIISRVVNAEDSMCGVNYKLAHRILGCNYGSIYS